MRHAIREWIVDADGWMTELLMDGLMAVVVALVATESLRSLFASL